MRAHWSELAHRGRIEALQDFRTADVAAVYENDGTTLAPGFAKERCAVLASPPLGFDRRFWCVN